MKRIIYIGMLFTFIWQGCYKDKGSYEYQPLNQITISGIKDSYELNVGDELVIEPQLTFALSENPDVSYRWRIDTVEIADTRNLKMEVALRVKNGYYGDFAVIDRHTGIAYMKTFKLSVSSKYKSGWLLLSEKEGAAKLDYITEERELIEDVYTRLNGKPLPGSCCRMAEDLHSSWDETALGQIVIMSDEGAEKSVILDGADFSQVVTLNEEFVDGKAPAGLIPMAYAVGGYYRYIVDQHGKVYSKYSQKGIYQEGYFNPFPAMGDYKMMPLISENVAMPGIRAATLFFDVSDPVKGYQYMYGIEGEVMAYDTTKDTGKKFNLIGMDKKVMGMGPSSDAGNGRTYYSVFLKSNTENKYYVQSLGFGMTWGRTPWMKSVVETEFPKPSVINDHSLVVTEFGRDRLYIATGSKLYVYDILLGREEVEGGWQEDTRAVTLLRDFGDGKIIRSMATGYSPDRNIYELGVAVENGEHGDFYLLDVSSEGVALPGNCVIFKEFPGVMGHPKQVLYKMGDPWRMQL